ncbi:MAG: hypothetical protein ACTSUN_03400 [Promethearchaeota archaeon]
MNRREKRIIKLIKKFNALIQKAIEGHNCTDPYICKGNCCSIEIGVPKALAKILIKKKLAKPSDFIRDNVFSFKLRFDPNSGKCFLFDEKINGCSIHFSGLKPPQCWIYPTGFSQASKNDIACKKTKEWKIVSPKKAKKAERIFSRYILKCKEEARNEIKDIEKRIGKFESPKSKKIYKYLQQELMNIPPSQVAGFQDGWSSFNLLPAEGYSLQLKKICEIYNPSCSILHDNFLNCTHICLKVSNAILNLLFQNLQDFISREGIPPSGEYPFYLLFKFVNGKNKIEKS